MTDEPLLTLSQAAQHVGRSTRTLLRWMDAQHLKEAQKLPGPSGAYLFRRADVERAAARFDVEQVP